MSIIEETPNRCTILDPSNLDNLASHQEPSDDDEILNLDRIPYNARSIQQVSSDKERLQFFVRNNASIVVELPTDAKLLDNQLETIESEDSLFRYD